MSKGRNDFTQEKILQLEQNIHVKRVSEKTVSFTKEFTNKVWQCIIIAASNQVKYL